MTDYNTIIKKTSLTSQITIPKSIINNCKQSLSTSIILLEKQDGTISKICGKKRGNATYNFCQTARVNLINKLATKKLNVIEEKNISNTVFITLTTHYIKGSITSTLKAIDKVQKQLPKFLRYFRKNYQDVSYLFCKECHKNGGFHCHLVLQFNKDKFQFFQDSKKNYRNDKLRDEIKKAWSIGNVDVKGVMSDNGIFNYISKEINKSQNVENALYRIEHNQELKKNDSNKVWLLGAIFEYSKQYEKITGTKKNVRTFGYSKDFQVSKEEIEEEKNRMISEYKDALINNMNKSIGRNKQNDLLDDLVSNENNKVVRYVVMSKEFVKHLPNFYKSGVIKNDDDKKVYKKVLDNYSIPAIHGQIDLGIIFNKN